MDPSADLLRSVLSTASRDAIRETAIEEHEPFDTKLFERAKDLARQEEDLIEEIAALRRKVPGAVAEKVKREYKEGLEGDERVLARLEERREMGCADLGVRRLERQEEVERGWETGVKGLEGLMETMPETVARKERAEKAEAYVRRGEKR
jgi:kinetochor protein Mis14/NSL1